MKSRLPAFLSKDKICIICEGDEEYDYLNEKSNPPAMLGRIE